jgi:hypothetical protein
MGTGLSFKTQWPNHDGHVEFRKEHYELYERYGISSKDMHKYGLLSYIIRGFQVKKIYDEFVEKGMFALGRIDKMKSYEWLGGCGPNRQASLDFKLQIPSQDIKKNKTMYIIHIKTERREDAPDNEYFITGNLVQNSVSHACESNGYQGIIQRFTPCKHFIAAQLILQERSEDWCNERDEEFYHGLKIGEIYKTEEGLPMHIFNPIPDEIIELYIKDTKGMKKHDILSLNREAAILHKTTLYKYQSGLLTHKQRLIVEPILEINGDI